MERAVILSNTTRLILVVLIILAAIAIIHLVASSKKLDGRSGPVTVCVVIVMLVAFVALAFLGSGSPDPSELDGFVSPEQNDAAAVAELVGSAARADLLDADSGTPVEISQLELNFDGSGAFERLMLYARYTYDKGSWTCAISVNAKGEATITDAEPDKQWAWADADTVAAAIAALDGVGDCDMAAESDAASSVAEADAAAQVFDGEGFVAAGEYAGAAELIYVSAGDTVSFYVPAA